MHAGQLRRVAAEIKHCCQCLAAVLRSNAPVGQAIQQLGKLEEAFLELQRAVGSAASAGAANPAGHKLAEETAERLIAAEQQVEAAAEEAKAGAEAEAADATGADLRVPAAGAFRPQRQPVVPALPLADAGADAAQDSLALHLSLSMLFTCCTRVGACTAMFTSAALLQAWHALTCACTVPYKLPPSMRGAQSCLQKEHPSLLPNPALSCLAAITAACPAGAGHVPAAAPGGGPRPAGRGGSSG